MQGSGLRGEGSRTPTPGASGSDDLVSALLTASRVLVGVSARSVADVEDTVTHTQFRTMVVLSARGGSTLVQVASRLGVNASTAQRQVDRLVGLGLVDRRANPGDRREIVITLTHEGRTIVGRVTRHRRAAISRIVATMPPDQRGALVEALAAFSTAAGEPRDPADEPSRLGW